MCVCLENCRVASWGSGDGLQRIAKKNTPCSLSLFSDTRQALRWAVYTKQNQIWRVSKSGTAKNASVLWTIGVVRLFNGICARWRSLLVAEWHVQKLNQLCDIVVWLHVKQVWVSDWSSPLARHQCWEIIRYDHVEGVSGIKRQMIIWVYKALSSMRMILIYLFEN